MALKTAETIFNKIIRPQTIIIYKFSKLYTILK